MRINRRLPHHGGVAIQAPHTEFRILPEAFPATTLQTCIVHLIRNSLEYASWKERRELAAALKPIYTAVDAQAAEAKRRALGVRDTLISQGILAQRIILRKPEQTTGSGNNVEARRVELLLLD